MDLKYNSEGRFRFHRGMKSSRPTANAWTNYTSRRPTITERRAEPSLLAWSATAEPTQDLHLPHVAQRIQVSETLYPTGVRGELPPPQTGDSMVRAQAKRLTESAVCWRRRQIPSHVYSRNRKNSSKHSNGKSRGKKTRAKCAVLPELEAGAIMHFQVLSSFWANKNTARMPPRSHKVS